MSFAGFVAGRLATITVQLVAEPPRYPDRGDGASGPADSESTRSTSLWTKVLIVIFGLLIVIALVAHLVVGGGPRH